MANAKIKVTQYKSVIGRLPSHKACIQGLGLRRVGHTGEVEDGPAIRGMIDEVACVVRVEGEDRKRNDVRSAPGARSAKRRVGRGIGTGLGKTAGRGHKGLTSRSGG